LEFSVGCWKTLRRIAISGAALGNPVGSEIFRRAVGRSCEAFPFPVGRRNFLRRVEKRYGAFRFPVALWRIRWGVEFSDEPSENAAAR
jgi:hypothetical protein